MKEILFQTNDKYDHRNCCSINLIKHEHVEGNQAHALEESLKSSGNTKIYFDSVLWVLTVKRPPTETTEVWL